ncbi:MAG: hypothetical protein PHQ72_06920 [Hespellia sp.]|nr:hypothetical protein [Hespellia sp.]
MNSQRARDAENRTERRLSNGPPRAQSKAHHITGAEYSVTWGLRQ